MNQPFQIPSSLKRSLIAVAIVGAVEHRVGIFATSKKACGLARERGQVGLRQRRCEAADFSKIERGEDIHTEQLRIRRERSGI